jgi:hypothetical protein
VVGLVSTENIELLEETKFAYDDNVCFDCFKKMKELKLISELAYRNSKLTTLIGSIALYLLKPSFFRIFCLTVGFFGALVILPPDVLAGALLPVETALGKTGFASSSSSSP